MTSMLPTSNVGAGDNDPSAKPHRVDVHHHPNFNGRNPEARARFLKSAPDFARVLDRTQEQAIEAMDEGGCATAVLSNPGMGASDEDRRDPQRLQRAARTVNEYTAKLVADYPGRFGMFASVPMPHVDAALRELEYALATLQADGIVLPTNFGDTWPGDPAYAPFFDELNRRGTVVFFHPTAPDCCLQTLPEVPVHFLEYPTDTARCAVSLLYGGTLKRCPDIPLILSHGGGSLPALANRIAGLANARPLLKERVPNGDPVAALSSFYFDMVGITNRPAFAGLTAFTQLSHLLFGTDYPFGTSAATAAGIASLLESPADRRAIDCENAFALLPRIRRFVESVGEEG